MPSIIERRIPKYPKIRPEIANRLPLYFVGSRLNFKRDICPQITAGIAVKIPNIIQLKNPSIRQGTANGSVSCVRSGENGDGVFVCIV